jgi:transcriptional regulator with XRE-family HTH domain
MGELGERLRAAREEKGLGLEEVAEATRMPLNYLQALENEELGRFTSELHARGFLRNYAAYLGLDTQETLAIYDEVRTAGSRRRAPVPLPLPAKQKSAARPSFLATDLLLGLVAMSIIGLGVFAAYVRNNHVEPTPTAGVPPTPTATPLPVYSGTSYEMDVYLDYVGRALDVKQRIDYTNVTSKTLPNVMLNIHANHFRNTFKLNDIRVDVDGEWERPETAPLDVTLRVELPSPLKPGEHVAIMLDYSLKLPSISPDADFIRGSFGYSKRAISLGNWYPVMAPYREQEDKGWYGQTYFEIGDPYVTEVADYRVSITTTQGVVLAGTGLETHSGNRWDFEAEQVRSFALAASDQYLVSTTNVGGVNLHSYYFANNQEAGQVALETAARAVELFSELYGPYPYADYRVAETEFAGGMEFSGVTFIGSVFYDAYDGTSRTPLIPLVAHEVSHQWFYGLVGNDQIVEPWLDEAPAEYSAFLYYERYLPEDADWWWFYAVDQWAPAGKIDSILYLFRNNREYMDAVYRRGAQFMRDLREVMGDPAFFGFLAEYQRRHAHRLARSRDFFSLVQEYTTADLMPLQEEYFRQRILP